MKELITVIAVISKILIVNSRIISKQIIDEDLDSRESTEDRSAIRWKDEDETIEKADDMDSAENEQHIEENKDEFNQPCAIVIQAHAPTMQSLIRRYRYDANGILIPSSVRYFMKLLHQPKHGSVLVPVRDQAYSPLGGFIRYYKHVPPIPPFW